jgi:hypothetical protein
MVVAGRTIPRNGNAVGGLLNARHDREAGHSAGLCDGEMWNALRETGQIAQEKTGHRK